MGGTVRAALEAAPNIAAASRWLADVYGDQHVERFAVAAAEEGSAFVPFVDDFDDTLCIQDERVVTHDNIAGHERRVP